MIRTKAIVALAAAGLASWPAPAAAQLTARLPDHLTRACDLPRARLAARTIAANPEVYPDFAARVNGGWLVYDRYDLQVVELDDELVEVARWGRRGGGPREYERPIAMARTGPDRVVVVDRDPPSLLVLGAEPAEHAIPLRVVPVNAIVAGTTVVIAGRDGSLHEAPLDRPEDVREVWSSADFGVTRTAAGALPVMLLRSSQAGQLYVGFKGPSTIWSLAADHPREVARRCVPEPLRNVHQEAPLVELSGFGKVPYTVETLQDFVVTGDGRILTLGGLRVGGDEDAARSIELYDRGGRLVRAWKLERRDARGVFDPGNPRRLLIWSGDEVGGVQLIEVAGDGFPSS